MGIEKLSETQIAIIDEISRAFDRLGAERGIFVALHSWGDTMSDLEVLQMLKEQNQQRLTKCIRRKHHNDNRPALATGCLSHLMQSQTLELR